VLFPKTLHFWQNSFHSSFPLFPFVKCFWLPLCRTAQQSVRFTHFSGGFLTTDCTDCTDESTVLAFSHPRHPCHLWSIRVLVAAQPRCASALNVFCMDTTKNAIYTGGRKMLSEKRNLNRRVFLSYSAKSSNKSPKSLSFLRKGAKNLKN
jgi:hypothetical protein